MESKKILVIDNDKKTNRETQASSTAETLRLEFIHDAKNWGPLLRCCITLESLWLCEAVLFFVDAN